MRQKDVYPYIFYIFIYICRQGGYDGIQQIDEEWSRARQGARCTFVLRITCCMHQLISRTSLLKRENRGEITGSQLLQSERFLCPSPSFVKGVLSWPGRCVLSLIKKGGCKRIPPEQRSRRPNFHMRVLIGKTRKGYPSHFGAMFG